MGKREMYKRGAEKIPGGQTRAELRNGVAVAQGKGAIDEKERKWKKERRW